MSSVAPKGRQPLAAAALFRRVRSSCDTLPDDRGGAAELALREALRSAVARFALPWPSLLACDTQRVAGPVGTLDGSERVPCDTPRRAILAPGAPASLRPSCPRVLRHLQRGQALAARACLAGPSLVSREGTGYCASTTMHGASCGPKGHRHGSSTYAHQMWGAAMVPPEPRAGSPLRPAPIGPPEGTDKQEGERHAAQRCLTQRRPEHPQLPLRLTADALRAPAPHSETLHAYGGPSMLGVKNGEQASWFQPGQAAAQAGRVTSYARPDRAAGVGPRLHLVHDVPRHAAHAAGRVHVIASGERGPDKGQPCRWVPDLRVSQRHVYRLMRGGRARWKSENETCKTLPHQGDHFAHTDGHGAQPRSVVWATRMR